MFAATKSISIFMVFDCGSTKFGLEIRASPAAFVQRSSPVKAWQNGYLPHRHSDVVLALLGLLAQLFHRPVNTAPPVRCFRHATKESQRQHRRAPFLPLSHTHAGTDTHLHVHTHVLVSQVVTDACIQFEPRIQNLRIHHKI